MNPQIALQAALEAQDPAAVRAAVAQGANPDARLPNGLWPLLAVWAALPSDGDGAGGPLETNEQAQAFRRRAYGLMAVLFELGARADQRIEDTLTAFTVFVKEELSAFCADPHFRAQGEPNVEESIAALRMWLDRGAHPGEPTEEEGLGVLEYAEFLSYLDANDDLAFTPSHRAYVRALIPLLVEYGYPAKALDETLPDVGDRTRLRFEHLAHDQVLAQWGHFPDSLRHGTPEYREEVSRRADEAKKVMRTLADEGLRLRDLRAREQAEGTPETATAPRRQRLR
jgi:hypothetical protein